MERKQTQRIVPNNVNVLADLHRLKVLLKQKTICFDSVNRLKTRYEMVLEKASLKKNRVVIRPKIHQRSLEIMNKDDLHLYFKSNGSHSTVKPIEVAGDGNCLYNAVSIFQHGDSSLHLILRLLTTIELYTNWEYLKTVVDQMVAKHALTFPNKLEMVQLLFHFSSTDQIFDMSQLVNVFKAEAILNSDPGTFSSLAALIALSSVVGVKINSVYSPRSSRLFNLFTQVFQPHKTRTDNVVHLLWSTTQLGSYSIPNHFVLCLDVGSLQYITPISVLSNSIKMDSCNDGKRKKQMCLNFQPLKKPFNVQDSLTSNVAHFDPVELHPAASTSVLSSGAISSIPTNSIRQPFTVPFSDALSLTTTSSQPVKLTTTSMTSAPVRGKPQKSLTDCHPNDIGILLERLDKLSDSEKINFLDKVWKPPPEFIFPQHDDCGRRWRFSYSYICSDSPKFCKWLAYSAYYDGVFCLPCVLFGKGLGHTKLQKLFLEPLTRWNGMSAKLNNHQTKCPLHKRSMDVMHALIDQQSGEKQPIHRIIDSHRTARINANRKKLIPIIKTVILCARQNIALRGHRDDAKHLGEKAHNPGNFQSLLEFRIDSGDKVLANHFKDCPKNASYRSKTIQNEIIEVIGKFIRQVIAEEIKTARFFSVIADEATDVGLTEQMALVIRFIDGTSQIREEFVEFIECESTSAQHLVEKVQGGIESLSLDINDLRGQGYDGAGNMAGAKSGVSTRILEICPKAYYFHCASHRLNLAVSASTSIRGVKNMMDTIRKCSEIFHFSSKKNHLLQDQIKELMTTEMRTTLLDVCKTRWLQRIDGLERVQEMMVPILATLDLISSNHDDSYSREARSDAQGVYWTLKSFQFIIHLITVRFVMSYTLPLTFELQQKKLDVIKVYQAVDTVIESLQECRILIDKKHRDWYAEAVSFSAKIGTLPSIKRIAGQQTLRANYNVDDPCEYYKLSLTIPLLDRVIAELKGRFSKHHRIHSFGYFILPIAVVKGDDWKEHVREFSVQYKSDLPSVINLETEMDQWKIYWKRNYKEGKVPDTITSTLTHIDPMKHWFPNIYRILCLIAVVPASSNSCERSISKLRTLKTYLRSTMVQERLSSLALANIHRDIDLDPEKILDLFARSYPHRLDLLDILTV